MSNESQTVSPEAAASSTAATPSAEGRTGPVQVSDAALDEVRRLRDKKGLDEIVLRVGVKGGGCAGLTYTLTFDSSITEKDTVTEYDGVKLVVDRKSAIFIKGMTLDYSDALIGGGFKFENPNARKSCSCGTSFSA